KTDALFGEDVQSVVIDEASRCRPETWDAIRSTLTATRGPTRVIGNVKGRKNWFYVQSMKAKTTEGYAYHRLTAWDAVDGGVLAREEIEEAKRDLAPDVFKELYEALPSEQGANPFGLKNIDLAQVDSVSDSKAVVYGIDLAKSVDYTVIIGLNQKGDVCEFHRWQDTWKMTVPKILQIVKNGNAIVDSTGVGNPILEELRSFDSGFFGNYEGYTFTSKSKQTLMENLRLDFARERFKIPRQYETLIDELEIFEYEHTRNGVKYAAPVGSHDDCVMALALARYGFKNQSFGVYF
ncbi:MAG: hypothetical protein ACYTFG_21655, partial [Planctomycetota bacterium]